MVNGVVLLEVIAKLAVGHGLVRHNVGFFGDVRVDNRDDVLFLRAVDMEGPDETVALHKRQDNVFVAVAALHFGTLFRPDKGLVNFDNFAFTAHRREAAGAHGLANAMSHEPSRPIGDIQGPMKLVSRETFLA